MEHDDVDIAGNDENDDYETAKVKYIIFIIKTEPEEDTQKEDD